MNFIASALNSLSLRERGGVRGQWHVTCAWPLILTFSRWEKEYRQLADGGIYGEEYL